MKRPISRRLSCILLVLQAAIYLSFLAADLLWNGAGLVSVYLKYLSILLCLGIAVLLHRGAWNKRDSLLLICALFLTCVADLFLLLLYRPVPGLLAFCLVHLVYIRRYRPAAFLLAAAIAALAIAVCLTAEAVMGGPPAKYALSCLYGALILASTVFGFVSPLPQMNRCLVRTGMVLFLLCDIHVALFNVLAPGDAYYPFAAFLMWFFYLPAQVLLAISGYCFHEPSVAETAMRSDEQDQK